MHQYYLYILIKCYTAERRTEVKLILYLRIFFHPCQARGWDLYHSNVINSCVIGVYLLRGFVCLFVSHNSGLRDIIR